VRLPSIVLTLFAAVITASVGVAAQPPAATAPRWPVLEAYVGKVVLLDFWASWCSPCLQSFPWMNELQQKHGGEGLVVLAVNLDQDRSLAEAFLGKTPAKFRVEYDASGDIARQFEVRAMPTSFLIDRQGKVRVRHAGFKEKHGQEREQQIVQLLEEPAT
jgi:cytochrome c biogenesis protein CcmG, thiol:disulfide interchange protein DsbE